MSYESEGSLRIYLREIAKTPLLSIEEENILAEKMKIGTRQEREDAREHMIRANLRLVVKLAQDYSNYGLPVADLISEGNIGLMTAVERFDPNRGGKLSTYASWWIKQSIKRALANQSKTIRLPVHMVDKIAKVRRIRILLTEALGCEPTNQELAEELGLPLHNLEMIQQASQCPTSLNAPVNDGEATEFGEVIADPYAEDPGDALIDNEMLQHLPELLAVLDDRERQIIEMRFGLNGQNGMTLEDVGKEFGVTRERIRQLQNSAITKMRKALRKKEKSSGTVSSASISKGKPKGQPKVKGTKTLTIRRLPTGPIVIQAISILWDREYKTCLELMRSTREVKDIIRKYSTKPGPQLWEELHTIYFEREGHSAAEILQGVVLYDFTKEPAAGIMSEVPEGKVTQILKHLLAAS